MREFSQSEIEALEQLNLSATPDGKHVNGYSVPFKSQRAEKVDLGLLEKKAEEAERSNETTIGKG